MGCASSLNAAVAPNPKHVAGVGQETERAQQQQGPAEAPEKSAQDGVQAPAPPTPLGTDEGAPGPVERAVSLAWLMGFATRWRGTKCSWKVAKEFLSPEDGGGKGKPVVVTETNLDEHREKRRTAERRRSGAPVEVHYCDIPFEQMYTTDVVEWEVRKVARERDMSYASAVSARTGAPTYFVSHAWGSPFVDLVASVGAALAGAALDDTYVWLDIFSTSWYTFEPAIRSKHTAHADGTSLALPSPSARGCSPSTSPGAKRRIPSPYS